MSIRQTKVYKEMNSYHACEIAEGFGSGENATEREQEAAWQFLVDIRADRWLQGWFGRTMADLVRNGVIKPPLTKKRR